MALIIFVLLLALAFEYVNGFHDTANSIATTVSTKVLTPRQAITLAALFNLLGALSGVAVAKTIGKGLVDTHYVNVETILFALGAAIIERLLDRAGASVTESEPCVDASLPDGIGVTNVKTYNVESVARSCVEVLKARGG